MEIAKVQVSGCRCTPVRLEKIPSGIVGATVSIEYTDPVWNKLSKTVVFGSSVTKDILNAGSSVTVPAEVVSKAGVCLYMGIYGVDAENNVVIPTIWTELGKVQGAATPSGDTSTNPKLPVWAQLQGMIGNLTNLKTTAKGNLVAAINEAITKGGGTVNEQDVRRIVNDYLAANPPQQGEDGRSAYEIGIANGFTGTEAEWLESLNGRTPVYGEDYGTPEQIAGIAAQAAEAVMQEVNPLMTACEKWYPGTDLTEKFAGEIAGYTDPWSWIQARIKTGNYSGLHVNDYIPFVTKNNVSLNACIAGIDTYANYGNSPVGHHIDFICRELWPALKPINPVNYNNGLIPVENIASDGTATQYTLANQMNGIASIRLGGTEITDYTYDPETCTVTFSAAPGSGTLAVTGTGTELPWLACDLYHYLNSLKGQIPTSAGLNPTVGHVDYTHDGVYFQLPDALKAVIVEKRFLAGKRYSASGLLSNDISWGWVDLGKLWLPTEFEVFGSGIWGGSAGYPVGGSVQYPIFMGSMNRVKSRNGSRSGWWMLSPGTYTYTWCFADYSGIADNSYVSDAYIAAPVCFRVG